MQIWSLLKGSLLYNFIRVKLYSSLSLARWPKTFKPNSWMAVKRFVYATLLRNCAHSVGKRSSKEIHIGTSSNQIRSDQIGWTKPNLSLALAYTKLGYKIHCFRMANKLRFVGSCLAICNLFCSRLILLTAGTCQWPPLTDWTNRVDRLMSRRRPESRLRSKIKPSRREISTRHSLAESGAQFEVGNYSDEMFCWKKVQSNEIWSKLECSGSVTIIISANHSTNFVSELVTSRSDRSFVSQPNWVTKGEMT